MTKLKSSMATGVSFIMEKSAQIFLLGVWGNFSSGFGFMLCLAFNSILQSLAGVQIRGLTLWLVNSLEYSWVIYIFLQS